MLRESVFEADRTVVDREFCGGVRILAEVACAEELEGILKEKNLLRPEGTGSETFFVTDGAAKFAETGSRFLGRSLQAIKFTPSK